MRLALISSFLPSDTRGGAEAYVDLAARSLAERHDVVILTGSWTGSVDGIPIVRVPRLPKLYKSAPVAGRVLWHALDQWLPHVHVSIARQLRRIQPDVVMTHHPQGLSAAVFTAIAQNGLRHIHTAHDLNLLCARMTMTRDGEFCGGQCPGCRVQRLVRGTAIRRDLARLIGVSRYICERHVNAGIVPEHRASAIRLGADPGTTRLRTLNGASIVLGYIGTLAAHKGVLTLLEALRSVNEPWRLVIAGHGPLADVVREAARADERIEYLGHVEGAEKDAFFDRCDLVVIPSEWEEPATFVASEAAVRGIPLVVSARGGLMEAPEARAFRSGAPEELVRAIRWYADEPRRVEEASSRLLESREEFEWSTHMRRVEQLLDDVRAEPAPSTRRWRGASDVHRSF